MPSFSMAKKYYGYFARGVGLDVVKSNIERDLGGDVEVKQNLGRNNIYLFRFLCTLAIIQALMVELR